MVLSKFACHCLGRCKTRENRRIGSCVHQNSDGNNDQAHKLPNIQISPYFSNKATTLHQSMNLKTKNDLLITLKRLDPQHVNLDQIYNDKNNSIFSTEMAYQLYSAAFILLITLLNDVPNSHNWEYLVNGGFVITSPLLTHTLDMFFNYNGSEIKNMLLNPNNLWKHSYLACLYRVMCRFLKGNGFSPNCIMDQRIVCCILHISQFHLMNENNTLDFIPVWQFYQLLPKKFLNDNCYMHSSNSKFYHFVGDEQRITNLLLGVEMKRLLKQNKVLSKENKKLSNKINYRIKHRKINRDYVSTRKNLTQKKKKEKEKPKNKWNYHDDCQGKTWNKWKNKICTNKWLSEPYIKIENWFKPFDDNQILNHKLNKKTLKTIGLIHSCYICNKQYKQGQKLYLCRGCKRVYYCSKKHQKQHWKNQHSTVCKGKLKK